MQQPPTGAPQMRVMPAAARHARRSRTSGHDCVCVRPSVLPRVFLKVFWLEKDKGMVLASSDTL